MPSPPSTHPSHVHPLSLPNPHRTSLTEWMAHHHLPFRALTISDPPAHASSARELVVVSAVVGRGLLGSARVELVVRREEVRRVERLEGEEKDDGPGTVEVREVRRGDEEEQRFRWGGVPMRRDSGQSEAGMGREGRWIGGDDGGVLPRMSPPPRQPPQDPAVVATTHHHLLHATTPSSRAPLLRFPPPRAPISPAHSDGGQLTIHCGPTPNIGPGPTFPRARGRPVSPTYLLPNPLFSLPRTEQSTSLACGSSLDPPLPLHPPRGAPQLADFAFTPGTASGRKHARGWILDAREMEGRVGALCGDDQAGTGEMAGEWDRVVCRCAGGAEEVGCLGCGAPLGVLISSPCPHHALRSATPGAPHPGPRPVWFVPHQFADVVRPPQTSAPGGATGRGRAVGR